MQASPLDHPRGRSEHVTGVVVGDVIVPGSEEGGVENTGSPTAREKDRYLYPTPEEYDRAMWFLYSKRGEVKDFPGVRELCHEVLRGDYCRILRMNYLEFKRKYPQVFPMAAEGRSSLPQEARQLRSFLFHGITDLNTQDAEGFFWYVIDNIAYEKYRRFVRPIFLKWVGRKNTELKQLGLEEYEYKVDESYLVLALGQEIRERYGSSGSLFDYDTRAKIIGIDGGNLIAIVQRCFHEESHVQSFSRGLALGNVKLPWYPSSHSWLEVFTEFFTQRELRKWIAEQDEPFLPSYMNKYLRGVRRLEEVYRKMVQASGDERAVLRLFNKAYLEMDFSEVEREYSKLFPDETFAEAMRGFSDLDYQWGG